MNRTLPEGTIIGLSAFEHVPIDGRRGACVFECIAAALADGTSAVGLRQTVAAFIRRRPHAELYFGAELRRVSELTQLLANAGPTAYARDLAQEGVWGDACNRARDCGALVRAARARYAATRL